MRHNSWLPGLGALQTSFKGWSGRKAVSTSAYKTHTDWSDLSTHDAVLRDGHQSGQMGPPLVGWALRLVPANELWVAITVVVHSGALFSLWLRDVWDSGCSTSLGLEGFTGSRTLNWLTINREHKQKWNLCSLSQRLPNFNPQAKSGLWSVFVLPMSSGMLGWSFCYGLR